MCAAINCHYFMWDTWGNVVNSFTTVVLLIIVCCFPVFIRAFYSHPKILKKVWYREKDFMNKYGTLIKDLNTHRHGPKVFSYLYVSMFRKLWLVYMVVFMQE